MNTTPSEDWFNLCKNVSSEKDIELLETAKKFIAKLNWEEWEKEAYWKGYYEIASKNTIK